MHCLACCVMPFQAVGVRSLWSSTAGLLACLRCLVGCIGSAQSAWSLSMDNGMGRERHYANVHHLPTAGGGLHARR